VQALNRFLSHPWTKPGVWLVCALPALLLVSRGLANELGANPAEALLRGLGDWTLRMLCLTLAITPLRQALGLSALARWRRALGVWTFVYALLHALAYVWLDMGWVWMDVLVDVAKRPFITVGLLAWLLLVPLVATSFNRAIKSMGAARWQRLHRMVYVVAALALLHFYWMRAGKNNFAEVHVYASLLLAMGLWRVIWWARRRAQPSSVS
jgi:methionine sulfoxide reductase heme-binding subunit